jgi:hypothetical protein
MTPRKLLSSKQYWPSYQETYYQLSLKCMPIRAVLRTGDVTNAAEAMADDVEWFSTLLKMQIRIRDAGKKLLGMETALGKSAQDVAMTVAVVSLVIPVTDREQTKVDNLHQMEQKSLF